MKELCSFTQAGTTSFSQWCNISSLSSRPKPHLAHNDGRTLFFHLGRNHILLTMMKDSHPCWNTSCSQWWNIFSLTFIQEGTHPAHSDEKALHLHSSRREHILLTVMKGPALTSIQEGRHPAHSDGRDCTHIWSCRNQSYSHIRMAPSPPRLSYLVTNQVPPFS